MNLYKILRTLFGLILLLTGLNLIFQFAPIPEMAEPAMNFMVAIAAAKYVLPVSGLLCLAGGAAFVMNKYVALGALLILPFTFHIAAFHLTLDPATGLGSYVFFLLNLYMLHQNKAKYSELLKA